MRVEYLSMFTSRGVVPRLSSHLLAFRFVGTVRTGEKAEKIDVIKKLTAGFLLSLVAHPCRFPPLVLGTGL
ncbi:hypothetical protein BaRGS_00014563 [Batillaria attramentaria]|uniref:Uncharacterized protein n=1 Tax=Batillaria attramentaria TaxID=370345 RepID=A0ABD0L4R0_9CAEN